MNTKVNITVNTDMNINTNVNVSVNTSVNASCYNSLRIVRFSSANLAEIRALFLPLDWYSLTAGTWSHRLGSERVGREDLTTPPPTPLCQSSPSASAQVSRVRSTASPLALDTWALAEHATGQGGRGGKVQQLPHDLTPHPGQNQRPEFRTEVQLPPLWQQISYSLGREQDTAHRCFYRPLSDDRQR